MTRKKSLKKAKSALDRLSVSAGELFGRTFRIIERANLIEAAITMLQTRLEAALNGMGELWEEHEKLVNRLADFEGRLLIIERATGERFPLPPLASPTREMADSLVNRMADEPFYAGANTGIPVGDWVAKGEADGRRAGLAMKPARVAKRKRAPAKPKRVTMSPELSRKLRNAARRKRRADAKATRR